MLLLARRARVVVVGGSKRQLISLLTSSPLHVLRHQQHQHQRQSWANPNRHRRCISNARPSGPSWVAHPPQGSILTRAVDPCRRIIEIQRHIPQLHRQTIRGKKTTTVVNLDDLPQGSTRSVKKRKTVVSLDDLPQGFIRPEEGPKDDKISESALGVPLDDNDERTSPAYPSVVLQARRNMQKFDNCVLLTRVGGFYELYFKHAEEYGPLLNLKVAQKKTAAGPVPMVGNLCS